MEESTFRNQTNHPIALFSSPKKYKQRQLYKFIPKLVDRLQDLSLRYRNNESLDFSNLVKYLAISFNPELEFYGELLPGHHKRVRHHKYMYAVSILAIETHMNRRVSISIDCESDFLVNSIDIHGKHHSSTITHHSEQFVKYGGEEDFCVWQLTRFPFSYIVIEPREAVDRVIYKTSFAPYCWIIVVFAFVILLAVIIAIVYSLWISRGRSDRDLAKLLDDTQYTY